MSETESIDAPRVGLLLSGGLDSAVLLGHLLRRGHTVFPIYIRSDVNWTEQELAAIESFLVQVSGEGDLRPLTVLDLPVADLYGSHWSVTGEAVPGAETPDEAVYMPGRNALLAIKAALWCQLHNVAVLALAPLAANPFPDATDAFFEHFAASLSMATGSRISFARPFANLHKDEVILLGEGLPLEHTFSCVAPQAGLHCGTCNKCAERRRAFAALSLTDPTPYAAPLPSQAS